MSFKNIKKNRTSIKYNIDGAINSSFREVENGKLANILVDKISDNSEQPRHNYEPESLQELAVSIRMHGLLQPIIVRASETNPNEFNLIAGHRRLRAIKLNKEASINAIVIDTDDIKSATFALTENIQRSDLTDLELAIAYEKLMQLNDFVKYEEIAEYINKSLASVKLLMRFLKLSDALKHHILKSNYRGSYRWILKLIEVEDSLAIEIFDHVVLNKLKNIEAVAYIKNNSIEKKLTKKITKPAKYKMKNNENILSFTLDKKNIPNKMKDEYESVEQTILEFYKKLKAYDSN